MYGFTKIYLNNSLLLDKWNIYLFYFIIRNKELRDHFIWITAYVHTMAFQVSFLWFYNTQNGFPGGSAVKNPLANAGDTGMILASGRSCGEGDCSPLQHSCLGNPMDSEARQATVRSVTKVGHDLAAKPLAPPCVF